MQDTLFPTLLPTLPGCVTGIVGRREQEGKRTEWDLQCQECGAIETTNMLVLMKTLFHPCAPRTRTCPDCHKARHEGTQVSTLRMGCREALTGSHY